MRTTGKKSRKISKRKRNKAVKDFLKLQRDLRKICKRANTTSLLHLAIAITEYYRYFTTADKSIIRHKDEIYRKYIITIAESVYDVNSVEDLKKVAFLKGIYI